MTKMGLSQTHVFVMKQQHFVNLRHFDAAYRIGGVAAGRKIHLTNCIGIEDARLHHVHPGRADSIVPRQILLWPWQRLAEHLKAQSGDHCHVLGAATSEVVATIRMEQMFVYICNDYPVRLCAALLPALIRKSLL